MAFIVSNMLYAFIIFKVKKAGVVFQSELFEAETGLLTRRFYEVAAFTN